MVPANEKSLLTLHEAAQLLVATGTSAHGAEMMLARAIELGELQATLKRWTTEQWSGEKIPGHLRRAETFIIRNDLRSWLTVKGLAISAS
ncbi:MAG: hypothetical protein H6R15_929 [Proteobacteria bacterium]|nr:hypothetical protein [Pseudomonadota bacterium]